MKAAFSHSFELPVTRKKKVVVVGGGPTGCLAALAARRNGADTSHERDSYLRA
jgi:NADPH-dependent 2,4-dienoyl-CoA reductase/sulfur reductase-like enzyme